MTGRHAVRNGMYNVSFPYESGGLPAEEVTMAEVLSEAGYATAFYGKSHLGDIEESYMTNQGFDEALWTPYNQVPSLWVKEAEASGIITGMFPDLYPKDPYELDSEWRPSGWVWALEGTKGGPVKEYRDTSSAENYWSIDGECEERLLEFVRKNADAKKPFYAAYWPQIASFVPIPEKLTTSKSMLHDGLMRVDRFIGQLMDTLKELGLAENTLVVIMADNGPMVHNGPPGMVETIYRGGKGDYTEGGIRVPAFAWWPGVIEAGQVVGDIVHEADLFTTFARLAGATEHIPADRIIDGLDQTALLLKGDTFSRRDYNFVYTGPILAATIKGRFKRVWVGELPGLSGAAFYDLYNDPREAHGQMITLFHTKSMFNSMKARHELMKEKFPDREEAKAAPLAGIANARPETKAASKLRVDPEKLPFDASDIIAKGRPWDLTDMYE
jgi:arylsulfatase